MRSPLALVVLVAAVSLTVGCSSNSQNGSGSGGASGTTGGSNTGGTNNTGGSRNAGTSGSAGKTGTGGNAGKAGTAGSAGTGGATGTGGSGTACTRDSLEAAAKSLADALTAKDSSKIALASGATYVENTKTTAFTAGIWQTALTIAFRRSLLDVETCQSFSEIIVTEGHPYVLGVRMKLIDGKTSEIEALVTDDGDWLFDAAAYLKYSKAEDWSVIPAERQDTRATLIAVGNAYFDYFSDKTVKVPWGTPCTRLEGGKGYTGNTCDVGVPDGITFADKRWVVDRDLGTAVGLVRFGGANGLPDSHMFRSLEGKLRYVHTITVCTTTNCGM